MAIMHLLCLMFAFWIIKSITQKQDGMSRKGTLLIVIFKRQEPDDSRRTHWGRKISYNHSKIAGFRAVPTPSPPAKSQDYLLGCIFSPPLQSFLFFKWKYKNNLDSAHLSASAATLTYRRRRGRIVLQPSLRKKSPGFPTEASPMQHGRLNGVTKVFHIRGLAGDFQMDQKHLYSGLHPRASSFLIQISLQSLEFQTTILDFGDSIA